MLPYRPGDLGERQRGDVFGLFGGPDHHGVGRRLEALDEFVLPFWAEPAEPEDSGGVRKGGESAHRSVDRGVGISSQDVGHASLRAGPGSEIIQRLDIVTPAVDLGIFEPFVEHAGGPAGHTFRVSTGRKVANGLETFPGVAVHRKARKETDHDRGDRQKLDRRPEAGDRGQYSETEPQPHHGEQETGLSQIAVWDGAEREVEQGPHHGEEPDRRGSSMGQWTRDREQHREAGRHEKIATVISPLIQAQEKAVERVPVVRSPQPEVRQASEKVVEDPEDDQREHRDRHEESERGGPTGHSAPLLPSRAGSPRRGE